MHQYYALFGNEYITWIELAEKWRDLLSQQDDPKILENGIDKLMVHLIRNGNYIN